VAVLGEMLELGDEGRFTRMSPRAARPTWTRWYVAAMARALATRRAAGMSREVSRMRHERRRGRCRRDNQ
jgi:hypothetical protein